MWHSQWTYLYQRGRQEIRLRSSTERSVLEKISPARCVEGQLYDHGFLIFAEDVAHCTCNFAHGGVAFYCFEDGWY
jgi:hypothetical protein